MQSLSLTLNDAELIKTYRVDENRIVFVTDLVLDAPRRTHAVYIETTVIATSFFFFFITRGDAAEFHLLESTHK